MGGNGAVHLIRALFSKHAMQGRVVMIRPYFLFLLGTSFATMYPCGR
jgi:hypothetical protein